MLGNTPIRHLHIFDIDNIPYHHKYSTVHIHCLYRLGNSQIQLHHPIQRIEFQTHCIVDIYFFFHSSIRIVLCLCHNNWYTQHVDFRRMWSIAHALFLLSILEGIPTHYNSYKLFSTDHHRHTYCNLPPHYHKHRRLRNYIQIGFENKTHSTTAHITEKWFLYTIASLSRP